MLSCFYTSNSSQRVKQVAMPKPDKVLRFRPLKEVDGALSKLKMVLLFHPKPIVKELPAITAFAKRASAKKEKGRPR